MPSFFPLMCSCAKTTAHLACTAELVICKAQDIFRNLFTGEEHSDQYYMKKTSFYLSSRISMSQYDALPWRGLCTAQTGRSIPSTSVPTWWVC